MSWRMCSKEDVVSIHPVPVADLQDGWSEMVEGLIREYMDMPYYADPTAVTNEKHSGDGSNLLVVRRPPIISVTSLLVSDASLQPSDYVVFPNHVLLKNQTFPEGSLNVDISYQSGTAEVSQSVRLAAIAMIVAIINYRKRYGADSSIKWSSNDTKAGEESPNLNVGLTSHLTQIMKRLLKRSKILAR